MSACVCVCVPVGVSVCLYFPLENRLQSNRLTILCHPNGTQSKDVRSEHLILFISNFKNVRFFMGYK